ncbi:hypothetical protein BDZ45DRAFT_804742 [Acephala macrosclerotiorum]|nr:hypothetical protein BDZ45DRAFT_804742 [Acephala macrosclerotiorum]
MTTKPSLQMEFLLERAKVTNRTHPPERAGEAITSKQLWRLFYDHQTKVKLDMPFAPTDIHRDIAEQQTFEDLWGPENVKLFYDASSTSGSNQPSSTKSEPDPSSIHQNPKLKAGELSSTFKKLPIAEENQSDPRHIHPSRMSQVPCALRTNKHSLSMSSLDQDIRQLPEAGQPRLGGPERAITFIASNAYPALCGRRAAYIKSVLGPFPFLELILERVSPGHNQNVVRVWIEVRAGFNNVPREVVQSAINGLERGLRAFHLLDQEGLELNPPLGTFHGRYPELFRPSELADKEARRPLESAARQSMTRRSASGYRLQATHGRLAWSRSRSPGRRTEENGRDCHRIEASRLLQPHPRKSSEGLDDPGRYRGGRGSRSRSPARQREPTHRDRRPETNQRRGRLSPISFEEEGPTLVFRTKRDDEPKSTWKEQARKDAKDRYI